MAPARLDRILPHLDLEGRRKGEAASPDDEPELDPERELVGV